MIGWSSFVWRGRCSTSGVDVSPWPPGQLGRKYKARHRAIAVPRALRQGATAAPTRSRNSTAGSSPPSPAQLAAMIRRQVELAYSRIDADGSLREVRYQRDRRPPELDIRLGEPATLRPANHPPVPSRRPPNGRCAPQKHITPRPAFIARRAASRRQRATCSAREAEAEPLGERRHLPRRPGSHEPTTAALGDHRARAALFGWLTDVYITVMLRMP